MRRRKVKRRTKAVPKREHIADPDTYCVAGDIADELLPLPLGPMAVVPPSKKGDDDAQPTH